MPSIKKRGNTYRIMVSLGYDLAGKQIRKTTTYTPPDGVSDGKAEKLAKAYAYEFEKHCHGMTNMNENIRFDELQKWYFEEIAVHTLKPTTYAGNRHVINIYVLPYIGHMKLKDINTACIDRLFHTLQTDGKHKQKYKLRNPKDLQDCTIKALAQKAHILERTISSLLKGKSVLKATAEKIANATERKLNEMFEVTQKGGGLCVASIQRVRTTLSPIFATAVKKELMAKNPVSHATTPTSTEKKAKPFLNAEQCKELISHLHECTNPQMPRLYLTLLYTGMRVGELVGLHWNEVDLEHGYITVKYNFHLVNGKEVLSTPKTKSSARVISMPPQLITALAEQKQWQNIRKTELGNLWIENGLVFTGQYGGYMSSSYINKELHKLLRKHNLPDVHTHDLRHANASLLINMGVPVKVIAEHLGHTDTRVTEAIYAHIFNETMTQASDAIAKALATI